MQLSNRYFLLSAFIFASVVLSTKGNASVAVTFSLPQTSCCTNLVNGIDGFDFRPNTDIVVSALGWYDDGADGLNNSHPVGIFLTSTQTLVAPQAIVSSASELDTSNSFRFAKVTPFTLSAGTSYTLVGYGSGPNWDRYINNPVGGVQFNQDITYIRYRSSVSTGLEFPTLAGEVGLIQGLYLGPNMLYSPVPVPASAWFLVTGISMLVGKSSFSRRKLLKK